MLIILTRVPVHWRNWIYRRISSSTSRSLHWKRLKMWECWISPRIWSRNWIRRICSRWRVSTSWIWAEMESPLFRPVLSVSRSCWCSWISVWILWGRWVILETFSFNTISILSLLILYRLKMMHWRDWIPCRLSSFGTITFFSFRAVHSGDYPNSQICIWTTIASQPYPLKSWAPYSQRISDTCRCREVWSENCRQQASKCSRICCI